MGTFFSIICHYCYEKIQTKNKRIPILKHFERLEHRQPPDLAAEFNIQSFQFLVWEPVHTSKSSTRLGLFFKQKDFATFCPRQSNFLLNLDMLPTAMQSITKFMKLRILLNYQNYFLVYSQQYCWFTRINELHFLCNRILYSLAKISFESRLRTYKKSLSFSLFKSCSK